MAGHKERDPITGELKPTFTQLPGSEPTQHERIVQLEAEKADLVSRLADVELALADLFTT